MLPGVEVCDGKDNDCDGKADEDFANQGKACSVGKGVCLSQGKYVCKPDKAGLLCDAKSGTASQELCSGLDDDCDGEVDESVPLCVSTIAGSSLWGHKDGVGVAVRFNFPADLAIDSKGNLYVADDSNHRIRKIDPTGKVTTFAGRYFGYKDAVGAAAEFNRPWGVTSDSKDNLYVTEFSGGRIRKIDSTGKVTTIAGSGVRGFKDGLGPTAQFQFPFGLVLDGKGNLYVADFRNHRIRKI